MDAVASVIRGEGGRAHVRPLDVTTDGAVAATAAALRAEWGAIDAVVYSTGISATMSVETLRIAEIERQMAVNYVGFVRAVGAVLPDMVTRRRGTIVGVASLAGYRGLPRGAGYCASKAAMIAFMESLRIDLRPRGVHVLAVNCGFVDTPILEHVDWPRWIVTDVETAAGRIVSGLARDAREVHFPRRVSYPYKVIAALPGGAFEALMRWLPN